MIHPKTKIYCQATWALAFSSFLIFFNLYSIQPLISEFEKVYQISTNTANWIFAASALGLSCSLIPWALIADRFGRRLVLLLSLALSSIVSFAIILFSDDVIMWMILRFILGITLAGLPAVAVAYITDEFDKNAVVGAVGIYIAANSLGGISGRLVGGLMAELFTLQSPIWICCALTFTGLIYTLFFLPKEQHFRPQSLNIKTILQNLCEHIRNPLLISTYIIGGVCFGIFINLFTVVGLRLESAPWFLNNFQVSLLFLCYLSGTFSASMAGKFGKLYNPIHGMLAGWGLLLIGTLFTLLSSIYFIVLGLLICSIGFFFLHSLASSWVTRRATQARALSSALYLSCYYLGGSLGGFYLIAVWHMYDWFAVPLAATLILLFVPLLIYFIYRHYQEDPVH